MRHRRTYATAITPKTKEAVYHRDRGRCIFCGRPGLPEAHLVRRSQGGMGKEENIITVCRICHHMMDETEHRKTMEAIAEAYLRGFYPRWSRESVTYSKWQ